jgi:hypothetical protein
MRAYSFIPLKGETNMLNTVHGHRPSRVAVMVLTMLMAELVATACGNSLALGQQVSGPALVGPLVIRQVDQNGAVSFAGICKGQPASFSLTLSPFSVAGQTAASVEGLILPGVGPAGCLSTNGGENLVVTTVITPKFTNDGTLITADVVLLYVVSP